MYSGRMSYTCSGNGTIPVLTGFPVASARVSFSTLPILEEQESSSSSEEWTDLPRIYVSAYTDTGFIVTYENIPSEVGYIEFEYSAV